MSATGEPQLILDLTKSKNGRHHSVEFEFTLSEAGGRECRSIAFGLGLRDVYLSGRLCVPIFYGDSTVLIRSF